MPVGGKTNIQLLEAGLGRALSEVNGHPCDHRHGDYSRKKGFQFCPECGEKIVVKTICEFCGRHFYSAKAYLVHIIRAKKSHSAPLCPSCGARTVYHAHKKMDHVLVFFCEPCSHSVSVLPGRIVVSGIPTERQILDALVKWEKKSVTELKREEEPDPIDEGISRTDKVIRAALGDDW